MIENVAIPQAELAALCQRYAIRKLSLFGSVLRADFRADSDIDVLVEFEPEARINFFTFIDLQDGLTALFQRPVDLHTPNSLSRHMRTHIIETAQIVYERERQDAFA